MSTLAKLLDKPEVLVDTAIKKLEHLSGFVALDVHLLAEINTNARAKLTQLGLDPNDTTGPELYHSLQAKFELDNQKFTNKLGLSNKTPQEATEHFVNFVQHAHIHSQVWTLKRSVARNLLRQHPPRKLMRRLNYRSVESMLKKENIAELYVLLPTVESPAWLKVFAKDQVVLTSSDFETRRVEVVIVSSDRIKAMRTTEPFNAVPALGAMVLWPNSKMKKLGAVGMSLLFFETVNQLKAQSAFIKLKQFESDFGEQFVETMQDGLKAAAKIGSLPVSWQAWYAHLAKIQHESHTNLTHLEHEDIHHDNAMEVLAELSPQMRWWTSLDHVASLHTHKPVSFNLRDVLSNYLNQSSYKARSTQYFGESLWHKLLTNYLNYPAVAAHIINQLENRTLVPELVDINENYSSSVPNYETLEVGK